MGKLKDNPKLTAQDYIDFSKADLIDIDTWEKEKKKKKKREELKMRFSKRIQQPLFTKKPKTRTGRKMGISVPQGIRGLLGTIK